MTLQMFGSPLVTDKNVERHLIELGEVLLSEHHLDGAHVSGAVEPPQGKVGHECISYRLRIVQLMTSNGRVMMNEDTLGQRCRIANDRRTGKFDSPKV